MNPIQRADSLQRVLDDMTGNAEAIQSDHCVNPPFGCGKPVARFRDEVSCKEYLMSGMCQDCQDKVFQVTDGEA
jgi:hypothetical protein